MNAQNQIVGETYDTAGNLLTDPSFNTNSYVYNAENQMTEKDTTLSFYYDGDGKRVEKSSGTLYWYGADGSVLDTTNLQGVTTGTAASEYIYFGGRRIAKRDGPGDVYYYFGDHLQTVRSMAEVPQGTTTATLCFDADFYPFSGDPRLVISVCQNPNFLFTGKEHDTEDNLDYFGARYYSAQMGRFMTPDWDAKPISVPYASFGNPQSLNLYSYVKNDPTTTRDLDGHCGDAIVCGAEIGGTIGTFVEPGGGTAVGATAGIVVGAVIDAGLAGYLVYKHFFSSDSGNAPAATEQGRDAQGKFVPKQPGQSQPGAGAEKEGLAAEGATKNTQPIPGSTQIPDGVKPDGQYVEVKSGGSVSNTGQLTQAGQAAMDATGKPLVVVTTNPNVQVSKPAQNNPNLDIKPLDQDEQ